MGQYALRLGYAIALMGQYASQHGYAIALMGQYASRLGYAIAPHRGQYASQHGYAIAPPPGGNTLRSTAMCSLALCAYAVHLCGRYGRARNALANLCHSKAQSCRRRLAAGTYRDEYIGRMGRIAHDTQCKTQPLQARNHVLDWSPV